jgi:hypothetical protein
MLSDDILERSKSPFINVLTVVPIKDGPPRICIEARKVNSVTIPDRERTSPLHELLQKFNGVNIYEFNRFEFSVPPNPFESSRQ